MKTIITVNAPSDELSFEELLLWLTKQNSQDKFLINEYQNTTTYYITLKERTTTDTIIHKCENYRIV